MSVDYKETNGKCPVMHGGVTKAGELTPHDFGPTV